MNPNFHSLRWSNGCYRVHRRHGKRFTDQGPTVLEPEVLWSRLCWNLSWWSYSAQNCSRAIACRKIQRRHSWSYRSALSATAKLWSRLSTWQCKMSRGSCLSILSEPESQCSSLAALSPDLSPIEHLWNELVRCVCQNPPETLQELRDTFVHEWHSILQAFVQRLIGSICVGDPKLSLLQEVVTHVIELRKPPYCMTISVCPWFVLIMMLRNVVDIALFALPIWIEILWFLSISFSV